MSKISEFNRFFSSKSLASTYKPTFMKCLLDIGDCKDDEGQKWIKDVGNSLEVDLHFISLRFIRYYWPLLFKSKLKQEATATPIAVYRILKEFAEKGLFGKNKSRPSKKQLCEDKFHELRLRIIKEGIKPQVLTKLLNDCNIYDFGKKKNSIIIPKDVVEFMSDNKKTLESALNHVIAIYLEKINYAPNISIKLEEKIPRTTLNDDDFSELLRLSNGLCFYCHEKHDKYAQDHFIPWNYDSNTQSFNMVPACKHCNSSKSDNLPSKNFLDDILERNKKLSKISYGYSEKDFKIAYDVCKRKYHGTEPLWSGRE